MNTEYGTLKIEYSAESRRKFRVILIGEDDIVSSKELSSLDAARIHHVLANIEQCLRYEMKLSAKELSGTLPLLTIEESQLTVYINRLVIHERLYNDNDINTFTFTFKHFDDIDQVKNYFAEAQY